MNWLCVLLALGIWASKALAESDSTDELDPIVVTATRSETHEKQIANTVTVITAEEIRARRVNAVADILRVVPGLDVMSTGGTGQQTSVFTRGADSNQTLVLIDNIRMNDPGDPGNAFDFANLQVDDIERIEILRGAASAMWGADAMGGVIHIITKHGKGPASFNSLVEGGNYDTYKVGAGVSGEQDGLSYALNTSHFSNLGVSAAAQSMGNSERDKYLNTTLQTRLGYQVMDNLDFDWSLRFNGAETGLDNCGGFGYKSWNGPFIRCDNPDYFMDTNQLYTRGQGRWFLFDGLWEQRFGINFTSSDRSTYYTAKVDPGWIPAVDTQGQETKLEWLNFLHLNEQLTVIAGIEERFDDFKSQSGQVGLETGYGSSMNNTGFYLQNQSTWLERFSTTVGGRVDDNSRFGTYLTWRFNQVMEIPEWSNRIKANIGTGFRPPSLCELSKNCFGNPDLQPETSLDWDAGIEQDFFDRQVLAGVVYFDNNYSNLIQWNPAANGGLGQVENVSTAIAQGIETFVEFKPHPAWSVRANYTLDQTYGRYDAMTGQRSNEPLLLRPLNKGNFDVDYRAADGISMHLNVSIVGSRSSYDTQGSIRQVPGYVLANLSGNYEVSKEVTVFARLDNLLNKQYEQIWGYGTMGFYGIGGMTLKF